MPYYEIRRTVRYSVAADTDNEAVEFVRNCPPSVSNRVRVIQLEEPEVCGEFVPGEQGVARCST